MSDIKKFELNKYKQKDIYCFIILNYTRYMHIKFEEKFFRHEFPYLNFIIKKFESLEAELPQGFWSVQNSKLI